MICGNNCGNPGKLSCSACGTISYCSSDCQKSHWKNHKGACKIARANKTTGNKYQSATDTAGDNQVKQIQTPGNASGDINMNQINFAKLHAKRKEADAKYTSGDIKNAMKPMNEAIELAKLLPEPIASGETIQLLVNLSQSYLQLEDTPNAIKYVNNACVQGEHLVNIAPNAPSLGGPTAFNTKEDAIKDSILKAKDLLVFALTNKVQLLLTILQQTADSNGNGNGNGNGQQQQQQPPLLKIKLTNNERNDMIADLDVSSKRSRTISSEIWDAQDVQHFKIFRILSLVQEMKGNIQEAENFMLKGYQLVCNNKEQKNLEAQQYLCDEMIRLSMKQNNPLKALEYTLQDKIGLDNKSFDQDNLIYSDNACKQAQFQMGLREHIKHSEKNLLFALNIREKKLGLEHVAVADVLVMISKVREACGILTENENEDLLRRARDIYRLPSNSQMKKNGLFVASIDDDIDRISMLRSKQSENPFAAAAAQASAMGIGAGSNGAHEMPQNMTLKRLEPDSNSNSGNNSKGTTGAGGARGRRGIGGKHRTIKQVSVTNDDLFDENSSLTPTPTPPVPPPVEKETNTSSEATAAAATTTVTPKAFTIDDGDGIGRLNAALSIMELDKSPEAYSKAIPLMEQSVKIFIDKHGEGHENTKTAMNNLNILMNEELKSLWGEVADEFDMD